MLIVGRNQDGYRSMKRDVSFIMKKTNYDQQQYGFAWQIDYQDIEIYQDSRLPLDNPNAWQALVQLFNQKMEHLDVKLPNRTVFHLFLNCPAVLALGLGARSDVHHEVILGTTQRGVADSPYTPVLDLSLATIKKFSTIGIRIIKQKPEKPYQFISTTIPQPEILKDKQILVQVYLAGHDPSGDIKRMATKNDWPLVEINKSQPALPIGGETWLRAAQEVGSVLLELASQVERIHLCWSAPVALAFGVGMALGTHSPITLYQWNPADSTYYPVLNLETLREQNAS